MCYYFSLNPSPSSGSGVACAPPPPPTIHDCPPGLPPSYLFYFIIIDFSFCIGLRFLVYFAGKKICVPWFLYNTGKSYDHYIAQLSCLLTVCTFLKKNCVFVLLIYAYVGLTL